MTARINQAANTAVPIVKARSTLVCLAHDKVGKLPMPRVNVPQEVAAFVLSSAWRRTLTPAQGRHATLIGLRGFRTENSAGSLRGL